jgi:hypothetical protein
MTGREKPFDTVTVESTLTRGVPQLLNLDHLSNAEKDTLIRSLYQRLEAAERRIADLEARLDGPGKTPDNSSLPPSKGQKPNKPQRAERAGPRQGNLGRQGGGRPLALFFYKTVPPRETPPRALASRAVRSRPSAARSLRQDRPAAGAPCGDKSRALRWALPVLRRRHPSAGGSARIRASKCSLRSNGRARSIRRLATRSLR